jgi:hypothetical protein
MACYQAMEIELRTVDGRKVVLRGMTRGTPRIVLVHQMESIFRHGTEYILEIDIRSGYQQVGDLELGIMDDSYLGHMISVQGVQVH